MEASCISNTIENRTLKKKMKKGKIVFAGITFIISFCLALMVTNSFFGNKIFSKKDQKIDGLEKIQDGDMIFQTSQSSQCEAVRIATNSKFSHCGIVFNFNGELMVYEAVQPVRLTPLEQWITNGKDNAFVVKRLKNAKEIITPTMLKMMKEYGKTFHNKEYDLYFEWSDDKLYCSELVWKIYKKAAGIELCQLQKLSDFNLKNKIVKDILKMRYGNAIPLNEKVVAPSDIVNSEILETIIDTY
jgi:uncharacterized protein YycO